MGFFCGVGAAAGVALGGNGVVYRICFVPRRVCTPFRAARLRCRLALLPKLLPWRLLPPGRWREARPRALRRPPVPAPVSAVSLWP